jgi:hypothetical protein
VSISILVVLYSCEIKESKTIATLISAGGARKNVNLIIWNNGPKHLESIDYQNIQNRGFASVSVIETIENRALSKIYNDFINQWASERYVFLDHDSTLNNQFLDVALGDEQLHIGVPLITVTDEVKSPSMNIRKGHENGPYNHKDRIVGIGSGVVLSAYAVTLLKNKYTNVFDERFYLYAVDTTFFFRVRNSGLNRLIKLIKGFEHSLSRLEIESIEKIKFRKVERSYAIGLCTRYYFSQCKFLFLKIIIKRLLGRDTLSVRTVFSVLILGYHYRNNS